MRFEFYADGPTVENCPAVLVILISNTAVNTYKKHCEASSHHEAGKLDKFAIPCQ